MSGLGKILRYTVYGSFIGFFMALCAYSHVKWKGTFDEIGIALYTVCYIMLISGLLIMIFMYRLIRQIYRDALKED